MNPVKNTRHVTACILIVAVALLALPSVAPACAWDDCCPCCQPGCGTPGYWMNHPEAWQFDSTIITSITIGGITYSQADAIALMKAPVKGDKTLILFPALVAAELNVLIGNCDCCIADVIAAADAWLADHPAGSDDVTNCDWKCGEPLYLCLDAYNNGLLCAPSRDTVEDAD
jgi:hypothetical protein